MPTAAEIAQAAENWTRPAQNRAPSSDIAPYLPTAERLHFLEGWQAKSIVRQFIRSGLLPDDPALEKRFYWRLCDHLRKCRYNPHHAQLPAVQEHLTSLQNLNSPG